MKVAIAHDYLTQRGGAERVALQFSKHFDSAPVFTSVYSPSSTFSAFAARDVRTTWLQRLPLARSDPRFAMPLLPAAWNSLHVGDADVVICSSTGWSHGIQTDESTRKIVYCHNPARWLYQTDEYAVTRAERAALSVLRSRLVEWDKRAALTADAYIANSQVVAERIREAYGIEAAVIHPPMMLDIEGAQQPVEGVEAGYWLTLARGRGYKNIRVVEEAVSKMRDRQLVVAGTSKVGKSTEFDNVRYVGFVSEAQVRWLYSNARALVSVANEDFGLTPIEANAFGTPAAVLRSGGFVETVSDGVNGKFIDEAVPDAVAEALSTFPRFDGACLRRSAQQYSASVFCEQIEDIAKQQFSAMKRMTEVTDD